jgi:hypothetical protein
MILILKIKCRVQGIVFSVFKELSRTLVILYLVYFIRVSLSREPCGIVICKPTFHIFYFNFLTRCLPSCPTEVENTIIHQTTNSTATGKVFLK